MTYNILDGASETLSEIIEIVKKESPDYLTLNEANTFARDDSKILKEFARQKNLRGYSKLRKEDLIRLLEK